MPVKVGHDLYKATTGQIWTSFAAARKDELEDKMRRENDNEGAKILDSLSTEQIRALSDEMNRQHGELIGQESGARAVKKVLSENPDYVDCERNNFALLANLRAKGLSWPFTETELQQAVSDLRDLGDVLVLRERPPDQSGAKDSSFNEEEAYGLSMEELKARSDRQIRGF
jgi:hypothetical protein